MSDWTLADLIAPQSQIVDRTAPSETNVRALVHELSSEWLDDSVDMGDLLQWSFDRFALSMDCEFSFDQFESAFMLRRYQFKQLLHFVEQLGLLKDDGALVDLTAGIDHTMSAAYAACQGAFVLFNRMESSAAVVTGGMVIAA
jgi:hypothetical protein